MQMETHKQKKLLQKSKKWTEELIKSDMDRGKTPFNLQIVRKFDWSGKNWK